MKLATKDRPGGDELRRRAALEDPAVDDHADLVGERGGVLEVVGHEDRRQRELAQQLVELDPHGSPSCARRAPTAARRAAARPGSRASARASATRWRSPPDSSRPGRASRWEIRKRSSSSATGACAGAEAHVREHVEVGEQRVLLEQVAHLAPLGRHVDARRSVSSQRSLAERRRARDPGRSSPATTRSTVVLPGSRGPDERAVVGAVARASSAGRTRRSYEGDGRSGR